MLRTFALVTCILVSTLIRAQENYIHIPATASYIITLKPLTPTERMNAEAASRLEMFGNTSYNDEYYLYGSSGLSDDSRDNLTHYISLAISSPKTMGVDSARSIYVFHEQTDTCNYWAYIFPVSNEQAYSDAVKSTLFGDGSLTVTSNGFSSITEGKISAGWTANYAIVLLADYYFPTEATYSFFQYVEMADSQRIADSIIAVETVLAMQYEQNLMLSDSSRNARREMLEQENYEMKMLLDKGELPEDTLLQDNPYYYYDEYSYDDYEDIENEEEHDTQAWFILNRLMNLEYSQSIASNANFTGLLTEPFEAAYWYNYGLIKQTEYENNLRDAAYYMLAYGEEYFQMIDTSINSMWEGSYVAGLITFNDTVTIMEHRISPGGELSTLTTGMYRGKVHKKMLDYVRGDNLLSLICLSADMEKFMKFTGNVYREQMQYAQMGFIYNYYMMVWDIARVFIDEETVYELFDGKFVFAITDLKPVVSTYITYEYDDDFNRREVVQNQTEIIPEFIFMAGVGRSDDMQKILDVLVASKVLVLVKKDCYTLTNSKNPASQFYVVFTKGILMLTNNEDLVNNRLQSGYSGDKALSKDMRKMARSSPLVGWWNGQHTFETIKNIQKGDPDAPMNDELEQNVSSGMVIGKKGTNGVHRIQMIITMPADNSGEQRSPLDRLIRFMNGLFLITR